MNWEVIAFVVYFVLVIGIGVYFFRMIGLCNYE